MISLNMVLKSIYDWLFSKKIIKEKYMTDEEYEYTEKYIDHQMQEYIDEQHLVHWEAEAINLKELKDKKWPQ